ncbi:MAG: 50S ribosomal protein L25 [Dehalococcoidales bacterium]|nr:50S ribosomal protein L25 [Dehalococcoidales bacterium]
MKELKLSAAKRDVFGKKTRFLRRRGIIPANVFGHGLDSLALQCDLGEIRKVVAHAGMTRLVTLKVDGEAEPRSVFIRGLQRDPLTGDFIHVDFYQVRKDEKMMMEIPIVLVGEAPAMKGSGRMLTRGISRLTIECLPEKVPPQIEVDISKLVSVEQAIHVKDIVLDPDIIVQDDPDQLIVKVTEVQVRAEEEKPAVAAAAAAEAAPKAEEAKPAAEATPKAEKAEKPEKPEKAEKKA